MQRYQKTVIRQSPSPNNMSLLESLFPSLSGVNNEEGFPHWPEPAAPWSILGAGSEYGGLSQIERQIGIFGKGVAPPSDVRVDTSSGRVFIHPDAQVGQFVRIEGPCFIGAGAELRHAAYLRKGSWVCEGAVVGHAT